MLIRGRYLIADPSREDGILRDGALRVEGNRIAMVGKYRRLKELYPHDETIGSDRHAVLPGLVNAHDHGRGVSAFQLGVADDYQLAWMIALIGQRGVDPYLNALYSAAQLIESGVTTTLLSYYDPNPEGCEERLASVLRAYRDSGIRLVLALGILDESPIASTCERLLPGLPPTLKTRVRGFLESRRYLPPGQFFDLFGSLRGQCGDGLVNPMLGPVSVHWCSDGLLNDIRAEAERSRVGIHTHMLETIYQRDEALKRHGKTAVEHLAEIGFLGPQLSCAHCVWLDEKEIDLLAESGASVVNNTSSNLRLRSGIAPLNSLLRRGVNVAIGLDSNGLNDDDDLLQEARLVATLHRLPGAGQPCVTAEQALAMATRNGARAAGLGEQIGVLGVGKKADLILVDLDRVMTTGSDPGRGISESLIQRAKAQDVDTVMVDGELLLRDRRLLRVDKRAVAAELRAQLARPMDESAERAARLAESLRVYASKLCHAADINVVPLGVHPQN